MRARDGFVLASGVNVARLEHIAHHERLDCNATSLRTHTRQRAPHQPQQTAGMVPEPSWPSSATCAAKWPSCGPMAPSTEICHQTVPGQGRGSGSRSSTRVTADNSPRCSSTAASSARCSSRVATAPHRRRRTSSGREQRPPATRFCCCSAWRPLAHEARLAENDRSVAEARKATRDRGWGGGARRQPKSTTTFPY